jgi:hypothetical protein
VHTSYQNYVKMITIVQVSYKLSTIDIENEFPLISQIDDRLLDKLAKRFRGDEPTLDSELDDSKLADVDNETFMISSVWIKKTSKDAFLLPRHVFSAEPHLAVRFETPDRFSSKFKVGLEMSPTIKRGWTHFAATISTQLHLRG